MRKVHNIRVTRFFQIKLETLTSDSQLVSDHFLLKPFFDLKLSLGSVAIWILHCRGIEPGKKNQLPLLWKWERWRRCITFANKSCKNDLDFTAKLSDFHLFGLKRDLKGFKCMTVSWNFPRLFETFRSQKVHEFRYFMEKMKYFMDKMKNLSKH